MPPALTHIHTLSLHDALPISARQARTIDTIRRLIVEQNYRRDRIALLVLYWCALRRDELRQIQWRHVDLANRLVTVQGKGRRDRKSTRLNSSHRCISYAVFCL